MVAEGSSRADTTALAMPGGRMSPGRGAVLTSIPQVGSTGLVSVIPVTFALETSPPTPAEAHGSGPAHRNYFCISAELIFAFSLA